MTLDHLREIALIQISQAQRTNAMPFTDWLAQKLGTSHWVVAARLTDRLRDKGYTIALTQKRYAALRTEYDAR